MYQNCIIKNKNCCIWLFEEQKQVKRKRGKLWWLLDIPKVFVAKLQYNYPGNKQTELCPCGVHMTNEHLYSCNVLNEGNILQDKYEHKFYGNLTEQKLILDILEHNIKKHEKSTLAQDS